MSAAAAWSATVCRCSAACGPINRDDVFQKVPNVLRSAAKPAGLVRPRLLPGPYILHGKPRRDYNVSSLCLDNSIQPLLRSSTQPGSPRPSRCYYSRLPRVTKCHASRIRRKIPRLHVRPQGRMHAARGHRGAAAFPAQADARPRLRQGAARPRQVRRRQGQAGRLQVARRHRAVSIRHQGGPARHLSVRALCGAPRTNHPAARLLRHHRQGHRGRLHQGRPRPVDRPDGALHGLRRRAAGRHRAQRLRLRPVHRRARRALRRRAARLHRGAGVGRHDRAAGDAAAGLRRARALRHAVLRAQHRRGRGGHGRRHPQAAAAHRHLRRRAVERRDAPRPRGAARASGGRPLRAVRNHRAGRRGANATWRATACTAGRIISCSR